MQKNHSKIKTYGKHARVAYRTRGDGSLQSHGNEADLFKQFYPIRAHGDNVDSTTLRDFNTPAFP